MNSLKSERTAYCGLCKQYFVKNCSCLVTIARELFPCCPAFETFHWRRGFLCVQYLGLTLWHLVLPNTTFFINFQIFVAEIFQTVFFWILKYRSFESGKRLRAKCYDSTNIFSFFPFLQSHTRKKKNSWSTPPPSSSPSHPLPYIPQEWLNFVSALNTGSILNNSALCRTLELGWGKYVNKERRLRDQIRSKGCSSVTLILRLCEWGLSTVWLRYTEFTAFIIRLHLGSKYQTHKKSLAQPLSVCKSSILCSVSIIRLL